VADSTVVIEELVLRVPGLTAADARRVAEDIGRRLAAELPSWRLAALPRAAQLRVTVPAGTAPHEVAALVAAQITRALR
jgi:hypothetical protein